MNKTITVKCPSHETLGEVTMDKKIKTVLHSCGCYLRIEEKGTRYEVTVLPDNPPGNTEF